MEKKINTSKNILADIVNWLKEDSIICLFISYGLTKHGVYYYSKEKLNSIQDQKLIYIDLTKNNDLLNDDEWPWYIKNEGFVEYKSIDILPKDKENIYKFYL